MLFMSIDDASDVCSSHLIEEVIAQFLIQGRTVYLELPSVYLLSTLFNTIFRDEVKIESEQVDSNVNADADADGQVENESDNLKEDRYDAKNAEKIRKGYNVKCGAYLSNRYSSLDELIDYSVQQLPAYFDMKEVSVEYIEEYQNNKNKNYDDNRETVAQQNYSSQGNVLSEISTLFKSTIVKVTIKSNKKKNREKKALEEDNTKNNGKNRDNYNINVFRNQPSDKISVYTLLQLGISSYQKRMLFRLYLEYPLWYLNEHVADHILPWNMFVSLTEDSVDKKTRKDSSDRKKDKKAKYLTLQYSESRDFLELQSNDYSKIKLSKKGVCEVFLFIISYVGLCTILII